MNITNETEITVVARAIWENVSQLAGDYSEVRFEQILVRPRYQHLAQILRHASERVIAALDEKRPSAPSGFGAYSSAMKD